MRAFNVCLSPDVFLSMVFQAVLACGTPLIALRPRMASFVVLARSLPTSSVVPLLVFSPFSDLGHSDALVRNNNPRPLEHPSFVFFAGCVFMLLNRGASWSKGEQLPFFPPPIIPGFSPSARLRRSTSPRCSCVRKRAFFSRFIFWRGPDLFLVFFF